MKVPTLRLYGRLLRFLRPHAGLFAGSVILMAGFAAFSGLSLALIVPFTEIVLSGKSPRELAQRHGGGIPTGIPGLTIPSADPTEPAVPPLGSVPPAGSATVPRDISGAPTSPAVPAPVADLTQRGFSLRRALETRFYGWLQGRDRRETLWRFCLALFLVFLVKNLFWYGQSYLVVRVEQNVIRDIRHDIFGHLQSLSLDYFSATHSGTLISRVVNDIELVKGAIANGIADLTRQGLLLLVYLGTVLMASWQLFLMAILVLPPNLWIIDRIGSTLRRSSRVSQVKMARLTSVLSETLSAIRIVKAFGLEGDRAERFQVESRDYARTMVTMTRAGSLATPLTEMLGVGVAVAILWFAGSRVSVDGQGAGRFMLFIVGMLSMMQPIKAIAQVNIRIQQGLAGAKRIFEILDTEPTVADRPTAQAVRGLQREIRFEQVSFAYRPGVEVLQAIDLAIHRGEVIALVGPSGGGKSTLVDLIPRFHDPTGGRITLDGVDLRDLRLDGLRRLIGLVTQDTILFEGTVRENISMGRLGATGADIGAAAAAANAREFIEHLPEGYDTWIGERGALLSGGQRQRLAIARAILRNPEILIFDEATSSLDTESEALVQAAIDNLLRDRTAIVIAHRLSTVRNADRIVVVEDGRIVEVGRHEELLAEAGTYRRLYEMQFRDPGGQPEPAP
jgi:subfamily B ATP-binding cassette protein MsbA